MALFICLICFCSSLQVNAQETDSSADYFEGDILWVETSSDTTVVCYIIEEPPVVERVTNKSISLGYRVSINNVYSYTVRHDITFAYGIPYTSSHAAQIMSGKAYIIETNSSSAYYPDTSSIVINKGTVSNPAIFTSNIKTYTKSTNQLHGTLECYTRCYSDGSYY